MNSKTFIAIFISAITFASCSLFRKPQETAKDDLPVIHLDTIKVTAKTPEPLRYQPSATRLTDIIHTKLEVSFDWTKQYMYGKATITAKPYFYPTSVLMLNARGMEIKEIALIKKEMITTVSTNVKLDRKKRKIYEPITTVDTVITKLPLQFKYEGELLTIQLDKEYKNTDQYIVFIDYISKPNELKKEGGSFAINDDKGLYFINPDGKIKDKPKQIWTQGETESNSVWFPTIDHPNERMTQEIFITVEKKYVTLSNGELISSSDNGDDTRTDYWKMDLPHAPYLAMMAIGEFAVVKDKWKDMEVNYYVEKEYEPYAKAIFGNTPEMIEFFSNKLGVVYPWNKYSQVVVRDYTSGAMENTTATLHSEIIQKTDRELLDLNHEDFISHELFHQWFGDLVTCESWSNTPLNESFATYGEYLWEEFKYGSEAADYHSQISRSEYLSEAQRKKVNLIRFQYDDKDDMFDRHSYDKGGQVLHMLRKYVGDDAFFASLKLYLETNKFTSVEIHNLRLAFEQVTGEDLNWFFNQWFLSPGHPVLDIESEYDAASKKEKVEIKQVQNFENVPLFILPIYIDLYANGKVERKKIIVTKVDETFLFDANSKPDLVNVDAEKQLLCEKAENKSLEEWTFQYKNGPLYLDRDEALTEIIIKANDSSATEAERVSATETIRMAMNDKFFALREEAIVALKRIHPGHEKDIKDKLVEIATTDEKSEVRATALEYLSEKYTDVDLQSTYKNAVNDRSYSVVGVAFSAIAKTNITEGMKLAKQYENEKSLAIIDVIADLYSLNGTDENNDFYIKVADKYKGFSAITFITEYVSFLQRAKKEETVNAGVDVLADIAKDATTIKWVAYLAKKAISDLAEMYDLREKKALEQVENLKAVNVNASTTELEYQAGIAKDQKLKIMEIYNNLK